MGRQEAGNLVIFVMEIGGRKEASKMGGCVKAKVVVFCSSF